MARRSAASEAPSPNGSDGGRDASGKFTAGNRLGKGNPFGRRVAALRSALLEGLSESDMRELAQSLLAKAKSGDIAAAKLVLSYSVGEPLPPVDPDRLDEHEYDVARGRPGDLEKMLLAGNGQGY